MYSTVEHGVLISIIIPSYNCGRFLPGTLDSILSQQPDDYSLEVLVIDGGSTDNTHDVLTRYRPRLSQVVVEPDNGPAHAINKGLRLAQGDMLAWLNADDLYHADAMKRVAQCFRIHTDKAFVFGDCRIVDEQGREIRRWIKGVKRACFPFSCRPLFQTLNYVSQPATFFSRRAWQVAGPLREDLRAAFDYEFLLRLWDHGGAARVPGTPLADFRWHPGSISGLNFERQFQEEWEVAARDAGRWAPQVLAHALVRWGIVQIYRRMQRRAQE